MTSGVHADKERHVGDRLSVLTVVGQAQRAGMEQTPAHTRLEFNAAYPLEETAEALHAFRRLSSCAIELAKTCMGYMVRHTKHSSPRPQMIVLSPDAAPWAEV